MSSFGVLRLMNGTGTLQRIQLLQNAVKTSTIPVFQSRRDYSVRIGCASGFWGDTPTAVSQLVNKGKIDFLVMDYLAEVTMSLLVAAKQKNENMGWCPDFVQTLAPLLPKIKEQGIRVVANAGGVNPESCMQMMLMAAGQAEMTDLKVAMISGDDLYGLKHELTENECANPATVTSVNAYLGAGAISRALDLGADIVITGRCTDSSLALGPLIHKFKWPMDNFNLMASGSLAGHLIECGAQATGGIFTDWEDVSGWENNGFPIADCEENGSFILTKPDGTGGLVNRGTVGEQLVYEIDNPRRYLLPDVICDFSQVQMKEEVGGVKVTGAAGLPPTAYYKAGGTFQDGWKCTGVCPIIGPKAREKAHKTAQAIINRTRGLFKILKMPDFIRTHVQVLGSEEAYGANARAGNMETRDAVLWMSVHHSDKKALEIFAREIASAGTGMAPGLTAVVSGRPKPSPLLRFFSYLYPKDKMQVKIKMSDGHEEAFVQPNNRTTPLEQSVQSPSEEDLAIDSSIKGTFSYKVSDLAWTRSGDKGNTCNIGVVARDPKFYPALVSKLTPNIIAKYFAHKFEDGQPIECLRYKLPGICGLNFVMKNSLGGGGIASLNADPQGKGYGQMLADFRMENVPQLK